MSEQRRRASGFWIALVIVCMPMAVQIVYVALTQSARAAGPYILGLMFIVGIGGIVAFRDLRRRTKTNNQSTRQ